MRTYHPDYTKYGLSGMRVRELWAYCRQYPEWKYELASMLGISAQQYSTDPHGSDPGNPVLRLVEKREVLGRKIDLVERVARSIDGGRWYAALIQNVCGGKALEYIDPILLPTSRRNEYYMHRREFFILLSAELDKIDTRGAANQ